MHFEDGVCAQCGDKLYEGYQDDRINGPLKKLRPFKYTEYPFFCSQACAEKVISLDKLRREHEKDVRQEIKSIEEHNETLVLHYPSAAERPYLKTRLKENQDRIAALGRSDSVQQKIDKAYEQYFADFDHKSKADRPARLERIEQDLFKAELKHAASVQASNDVIAEVEKSRALRERNTPKPLEIPPDHLRFEHTHILGASGSGKTTLIQEFILHDLQRDDSPALVVIDPKGLLTERVRRLELIDPARLVVIDATLPNPVKLGLFSKSVVTGVDEEQTLTQAIGTYGYIFESGRFQFTAKQAICFDYCVRLMFETGGTLSSLMQLLRARTYQLPNNLPEEVRNFFEQDFYATGSGGYDSTRGEINVRLQAIAQRPMLKAMFDTQERDVDIFDCIQNRKIVLVNTGMSRDPVASQMLGRFIIAMVLNATYIRSTLPPDQWPPTFLYIDEFQQFMDESKTPEMLRLTREYNVGIVMAHHNMQGKELSDDLRSAISTNTSIKLCAAPGGLDLNYMARDLNCDAAFLRIQQKTKTDVRFAMYARGLHDDPISVAVPMGKIDTYAKRAAPVEPASPRPPARAAQPTPLPVQDVVRVAKQPDPDDFG